MDASTSGQIVLAMEILRDLAIGPNDYARLISQPAFRQVPGIRMREALEVLQAGGLASPSGVYETWRISATGLAMVRKFS